MSFRRNLLRNLRAGWTTWRRQLRRFATSPRLAFEYWRYREYIRRRNWAGIKAMLPSASQSALRAGDYRFARELGYAAIRLDQSEVGMRLVQASRQQSGSTKSTDWRGEDIGDSTLVVELMENQKQAVTAGMTVVGYIRAAAERAAKTIVVCEPRMVPIFRRTLPGVIVCAFGADLKPHLQGRVVTADTVDLSNVLGYDPDTIRRLHAPISPDRAEAAKLRERYLRGRVVPLVGIAWWSSHIGKDLPSVPDWADFVRRYPAQFVSVQYAQRDTDVAALRGDNAGKLIVDREIDQLSDMDRFASQLAALDLVVTISNSGAHLAGAMGQRVILVRDDLFRRGWPYLSCTVPWYPNTVVVGKNDRDWSEVFNEVERIGREMLGS